MFIYHMDAAITKVATDTLSLPFVPLSLSNNMSELAKIVILLRETGRSVTVGEPFRGHYMPHQIHHTLCSTVQRLIM